MNQRYRTHAMRARRPRPLNDKRRLGAVPAALLAGLLLPAASSAQAVCSAPHSSPTVSSSGSILTLDPGAGWVQLAARGSRATQFYGTTGSVHDLPGGTETTTMSAYITAAVGVVPGVEVWGQLPIHRLRVAEIGQTRVRTAVGDPRVSARVGPGLFGRGDIPVSVRFGVKFPGSDFAIDPNVLPLSEGQIDYEVAFEGGSTLTDGGLYAVAWAGYRWRTLDRESDREPGDERFGHLAVGGPLGAFRLELGLEVLDGMTPINNAVRIPASARRLFQLSPTVSWEAGAGRLEVGGQFPVSGRSLPTGPAVSLGYVLAWSGR